MRLNHNYNKFIIVIIIMIKSYNSEIRNSEFAYSHTFLLLILYISRNIYLEMFVVLVKRKQCTFWEKHEDIGSWNSNVKH